MRSAHVACQIKNEQKAKAAATAKPTPAATTAEAEAAAAENGTRAIAAASQASRATPHSVANFC